MERNMLVCGGRNLPAKTTVAVAVKGNGGGRGGNGSCRAVRWAVENLMPKADRFVLIHVVPRITSVPTLSGANIPIEQLDTHVVEMYMKDAKEEFQKIFLPFKKLCKRKKIETLVLEGDNPASVLLKYVTDSGVSSLVLGSCTSCFLTSFMVRKLEDSLVPSAVLKKAPKACSIYIVSRQRLITNSVTPLSRGENSSRQWWFTCRDLSSLRIYKLNGGHRSSTVDCGVTDTVSLVSDISRSSQGYPNHSGPFQERNHRNWGNSSREIEALVAGHYSSPVDCEVNEIASSVLDLSHFNSVRYPNHSGPLPEGNHQNSGNSTIDIEAFNERSSVASNDTKQSDVQAEVEKMRLEFMNTRGMYYRAREDLIHTQKEVHYLFSKCLEEERQVDAALKRERAYKKIAAEDKRKHLEAVEVIEMAKKLLGKEAYEKKIAERIAERESLEKKKIMDALLSNDRRYRRYTRNDIERATDSFSEAKMIGEGSYGKVYRCELDKTPVAVKVLHCSDATEKKKEFLTEIEVLSQLRHPHMVLLLGACPEIGCLVFEYMENGSLEDFVSDQSSRDPLPWFVRFRIAFEVACGLAFLHNSKPHPIIHRDLKPGNIFLDRNYVSKIGDVGLAKLVSDVTPDNITQYRDSTVFGTLHYVDPEYHRTGTVRPKSDLYAFGIIVLQLLAAQHPDGLLLNFETALSNGLLSDILDISIPDWPFTEAEELAQMALRCSSLRCRDRPDLETEVLPLLKKLADMADVASRVQRNIIHAPNHFFCPILQEVMEDPYVAADGFTYEHRAIKAWLARHSLSPVTKLRLEHKVIIQNNTLRSAIEDWRFGGHT
ncbi:U-box domain-containing protein 34-like [Rhododendron vialii]|uniref:U-box domain-containing protein 34-like n=1 Tax=Rhododendron vialii TaxID=182163 RepID=UPI00265F1442|nr:U-box domain-containing protein 34-like [Rhododendron vialii]